MDAAIVPYISKMDWQQKDVEYTNPQKLPFHGGFCGFYTLMR